MRFDAMLMVLAVVLVLVGFSGLAFGQEWQPVEGGLLTEWGEEMDVDDVLGEYPRPQMVRKDWLNLNGLWDYAIRPRGDEELGAEVDGEILVPFAVESVLSGVGKRVSAEECLWYRREFVMPSDWDYENRVVLHFGAVDWETTVWVNGQEVGYGQGSKTPTEVNIPPYLRDAENVLAEKELDRLLDPRPMTEPGIPGKTR